MSFRWMRAATALLLAPAAALAFETVDTLPLPWRGAFPAYEPGPIYPTNLWLQAGIMFDSNPFRIADGANTQALLGRPEKSDTIMRFGAGVSHTQRVIGRQSVRLGARADYFDYWRHNRLDHLAYGLSAEWLWELGNDLNGTIGYGRTFGLADTAETQRVSVDEIVTDRLFATAIYRILPDWRLRAGVESGKSERTGDRIDLNSDLKRVIAGVDYVTPLGNTIGLEARETRGSAPVTPLLDPGGVFIDNDFKEREVALVAAYALGPQLRLGGTIGRATRSYTELPVDDFSGTTYRARVDWQPGLKTLLGFDIYRVTRAVLDVDATHVVARGASIGPSWAPTAKLVFSARFVNERRQFQSTVDTGLPLRDETLRVWRFGGGWEIRRHIALTAGLDLGERTSNTVGRDYDYVAVMANLRYDW